MELYLALSVLIGMYHLQLFGLVFMMERALTFTRYCTKIITGVPNGWISQCGLPEDDVLRFKKTLRVESSVRKA